MTLLVTPEFELSVPEDEYDLTAKYHVPDARPLMTWLVVAAPGTWTI